MTAFVLWFLFWVVVLLNVGLHYRKKRERAAASKRIAQRQKFRHRL